MRVQLKATERESAAWEVALLVFLLQSGAIGRGHFRSHPNDTIQSAWRLHGRQAVLCPGTVAVGGVGPIRDVRLTLREGLYSAYRPIL